MLLINSLLVFLVRGNVNIAAGDFELAARVQCLVDHLLGLFREFFLVRVIWLGDLNSGLFFELFNLALEVDFPVRLFDFLLGLGQTLRHEFVAVVLVPVLTLGKAGGHLAIEDAAHLHQVRGVVVLVELPDIGSLYLA